MAFDLQSSQLSINTRLLQYLESMYSHITCQKFIFTEKKCSANISDPFKKLKLIQIIEEKLSQRGSSRKRMRKLTAFEKKSPSFLVYFVPSSVVKKLLTLKMYMDLCRTQFQLLTVLWLGPFDPLQKKRPIYKIQNCFFQVF